MEWFSGPLVLDLYLTYSRRYDPAPYSNFGILSIAKRQLTDELLECFTPSVGAKGGRTGAPHIDIEV